MPPPGELLFDDPPGDCHIKFGYLKSSDTFTVKIATGFWKNPARGLPSSNGVVLVFSRNTGELCSILQDEGWLTDIRTAAAGAVAANPAEEKIRSTAGLGQSFSTAARTTKMSSKWMPRKFARAKLE